MTDQELSREEHLEIRVEECLELLTIIAEHIEEKADKILVVIAPTDN